MNAQRSFSPSATIVDSKWSALALIVAGIALGLSVMVCYVQATAYRELERENRLLQVKVDDMRVALNSQGIKTSKHFEGDSP